MSLAVAWAAIGLLAACGQPPDNSEALRSIENSANGTPPGTGPGQVPPASDPGVKPGTPGAKPPPTAAQLVKSEDFFLNNVLPLMKGLPCSDCHNAPRNLKDPNVNGGTSIQEHTAMLNLLKDGKGANDNKLINKLLGVIAHKGGKVCADEAAQPCGKIKEWYKSVFGDGTLSLGKIENINREGIISGWAGLIDAPTTAYDIRLYLDGDKGTGTALPPLTANLEAFDNGLPGAHAFSVKVPDAMIDGKPHKIFANVINGGKEEPIAGSPFSYQAYKPKTAATATAFAQVNFNACNGACHNFVYENRWGILLNNGADGTWSATSNSLYDKLSGKVAHGGPGLPGGTNLTALQQWWTQEFGP